MPKVSISEAAKLAGISRKHLYEKYINQGTISVSREEAKKPLIDTSEILRIFGVLHGDKQKSNNKTNTRNNMLHQIDTPHVTPEIYELRVKVAVLEAEKEGHTQLVNELRAQLERERNRLAQAEHKLLNTEGQIRSLLEDRTRQHTEIGQRFEKKSLFERIKAVFTG